MHRDDAIAVHLRDLGYVTRPIWDKTPEPFKNVIRLSNDDFLWKGFEGTSRSHSSPASFSRICKAHGLDVLDSGGVGNIPTVYDAVIFSVELDLLEIRMRELYDVVDTFMVAESNVTFSGDAREYVLEKNMDQFAFAKDKLVYIKIGDLTPHNPSSHLPKEDPFFNEIKMRVGVSRAIDTLFPHVGSIILQSDVDEIPSSKAVSLLKHCKGWGDVIHLGMPSYLYSFEYPMQRSKSSSKANNGEGAGSRQWRASAKRYGTASYRGYTHSRQSDAILERAGWHLTFAFKYLDDFVFKMKSYSHNDRVTSHKQLDPSVIQEKICTGGDVYDMLPEAYDFDTLYRQWGNIPSSTSTEGIPKWVLENRDRFKYLLPGGCKRQARISS